MSWVDQAFQFIVWLFVYFAIFSVIGMLFYGMDRMVKRRLARPVRCASCQAEFDASLLQKGFGKCPSCGHRQPGLKVAGRKQH